jgi:hypothetical protein
LKSTRSLAALAAATTLAALSPLLAPAAPAQADDPGDTEVAVYLSASPGSDAYGIFRRPLAGGAPVMLVKPDPLVERSEIAVSQDGRRYAYVETVYDAEGDPVRDRVIVRDVKGPFANRALDRPVVENEGIFGAALSPDGRTVVWSVATFPEIGAPSFSIRRASVFGGPSTLIAGSKGLIAPVFVTPTLLLATRADTGAQASIPLAGGTRVNGLAIPSGIGNVRVSPDGTRSCSTAGQPWSRRPASSRACPAGAATAPVCCSPELRTRTRSVTSGPLASRARPRRPSPSPRQTSSRSSSAAST